MSVSKSDLLSQLSKTYPNLLKRDLLKIFDIFLKEIKIALKNDERVELRGIPTMLLFSGGELKATKVGATTKSNIVTWIKDNI